MGQGLVRAGGGLHYGIHDDSPVGHSTGYPPFHFLSDHAPPFRVCCISWP